MPTSRASRVRVAIRLIRLALLLPAALLPVAAFAQPTAVVREPAPIYLHPDSARVPLRTAAEGTTLRILPGFFLTGGIGIGTASYGVEDAEIGAGVFLGLGWDIRVGRNVSLTPFWSGFAMANDNMDANVGQIGIGVTIH